MDERPLLIDSSPQPETDITSLAPSRRRALSAAAALAALCAGLAAAPAALAQAYPSKPIKLIVPFPAGGPTDVSARVIGQRMAQGLGQPVVVENRAGASGMIAAEAVAKSPPDGYTLMVLATPTLLGPHLYGKRSYDTLKDFTPIGSAYDLPIVMVVNPKSLPDVTSLAQLIAKAKATPGQMNYTSAGNGSFGHLSTELLKGLGGFDVRHIAYKGSAPAITDLLGGQVPMMFSDMIAALPHIQSGKLRPIAVGSPQRVALLPDVKTVAEQGFAGFDAVSWGAFVAPAGVPADIVARLSGELKTALADKEVQAKLVKVGTAAAYQPPEQLAARMRADYEKWGKVVQERGIRNE